MNTNDWIKLQSSGQHSIPMLVCFTTVSSSSINPAAAD